MLTDEQTETAALSLAKSLDYPWSYMTPKGREEMRKMARDAFGAATAPLLARIAELEAKLAQRVPDDLLRSAVFNVLEGFTLHHDARKIIEAAYYAAAPAAPEQQEPEDEQAAFERWAERVCPSGDVTEVQRHWEASSDLAEWLESQRTEDVLIDGVAYTVPTEVACELLRLHMVAQASNAQQAEPMCRIAKVKLDDLIESGHSVCGVMIEKTHIDGKVTRGAVSNGGMVVWWHPESMEAAHSNAQQAEAHEPVATVNISDDGFDIGLTDDYAFGIKRLPNGKHLLFTRPQPAQRPPLTIAEVEATIARWSYELHGDRARFIVRETELAHGIG